MTNKTLRSLSSSSWLIVASLAGLGGLTAGCAAKAGNPAPNSAEAQAGRVARGKMLVSIGGCNDCHTPMKFDPAVGMPVHQMDRLLSGHPVGAPDPGGTLGPHDMAGIGPTFTSFRLPFGVVYTANLTPDQDTGLGTWTEDIFVKAMRTGRHFGGTGRPILPPMPWMSLASQSEEDLRSIFAYLRSIPPI